MKKTNIALAIGLSGVIGLTACNDNAEDDANNNDGDEIVNVNGTAITEEELTDELMDEAGQEMFNQMVQNTVLQQKAEELDIGEEEVEAELEDMREQMGVEDDEQLVEMLQMQMQVPIDSVEELKEEFLLPQVVIQELSMEGVEISEEDKEAYFEENEESLIEVEARHILVDDEETAEEVLSELEDGMSFEDAVEEYSEDPQGEQEGGNVGYFTQDGQMDENFTETAFELDEGEISDPVESQFGYHIIEVLDRNDSYEELEEQIEDQLTQEQSRMPQEVIQELMEEADIEVTDSEYDDWLQDPNAMPMQ
ncbi:peptidylprolyl isomerase/foldase protein PrsA [Geomicrobium halophilum]|uniref:Foldase protein PrsA n=1 Tax=Geomicrobium halophilum TaxID=549000 RepID=A0A841PTA9_9BACL|nr:peptidylprolyl isomerase [Geomicrobium halophilum]MBB6449541.1 peptidylprolyl isomerase/foldase protein PrsA [Geomicrobium halophilum]